MATTVKDKAAITAASKNGFSLISDSKLKRIYSAMLTSRHMEERSAPNSGRKKPAVAGMEAMEIGAAIDLQPGDHLSLARNSRLDVVLKRNSKRVIVHSSAVKGQLDTILSVARDLKASGKLNIVVAFFEHKAAVKQCVVQGALCVGARRTPHTICVKWPRGRAFNGEDPGNYSLAVEQ